jgi:hypothetical protein
VSDSRSPDEFFHGRGIELVRTSERNTSAGIDIPIQNILFRNTVARGGTTEVVAHENHQFVAEYPVADGQGIFILRPSRRMPIGLFGRSYLDEYLERLDDSVALSKYKKVLAIIRRDIAACVTQFLEHAHDMEFAQ